MEKNFREFLSEMGFGEEDAKKIESIRTIIGKDIDEDIQSKIKELSERGVKDKDQIMDAIKDLQDKVESNRDVSNKNVFGKDLEPLEKSLRKMHESILSGNSPQKGEFEATSLRAATVMTLADVVSVAPDFVSTTVDKKIHAAPSPRLGVVARLNKGQTRTQATKYTYLAGSEGNAAVTEEGALKPLYSTSYNNAEAVIKKIPVRIKVSDEFLEFTEFFNDLKTRAQREIFRALEKEVVAGEGGADHLLGIIEVAPAFNVPALANTVSAPDISDAIFAQMTQIEMLGFDANVCFINSLDYAKLQLIKDSTNRPMTAEVMAKINQLTFVIVGSDIIPAGDTLVMDDRYWQLFVNEIKTKEGYGVQKVGTEYYSDIDLNLRTIIFELYAKSYCPAVELGAICYDSIATIQEAIAKTTGVTVPEPVTPEISATSLQEFDKDGDIQHSIVTASGEWTVVNDNVADTWFTVEAAGNTVCVIVTANSGVAAPARTGSFTVTLTGTTLTDTIIVAQAANV